jgi:hypothetical protein
MELPEVTSPEVTSPEAALTGNDVSHGSDRVRMRNQFPHFFLTIVVQNVSLRMTDMATRCDRRSRTPKGFT